MAQAYSQLPSHLLGLESGSLAAWCLDEAVFTWGTFVESELDKAADQGKDAESRVQFRRMRMEQLMSEGEEVDEEMTNVTPIQRAPRRFADPADFVTKKGGGDV